MVATSYGLQQSEDAVDGAGAAVVRAPEGWARARQRHFELRVLSQMLFAEPSPAPTKAALAMSSVFKQLGIECEGNMLGNMLHRESRRVLEGELYMQHPLPEVLVQMNELSAPGKPLAKERWAGVIDSVGSHTLANACASTR